MANFDAKQTRNYMRIVRTLLTLTIIGLWTTPAPAAVAKVARSANTRSALRTHHHHPRSRRSGPIRLHRARAAIVGGSQIPITQAPWQVFVNGRTFGSKVPTCGGAILNATHILTAAHCLFDPTNGDRLSPWGVTVIAGTSNIGSGEPEEQRAEVATMRVHPYFNYVPGGAIFEDDIAVLELSKALNLGGAAAQAIGLASAGSSLPEGTQVNLSGFGEQMPETEANGQLYALGMGLVLSRFCGREADAVYLCGTTSAGSACQGDSGSGLTIPGLTPTLIGVADTSESGGGCRDGWINSFTNLAAPEIQDFIDGSESPPRAPRGGDISTLAFPQAGYPMTCSPGTWSGSPTFSYAFVDSSTGQVLQSGPGQIYQLTAADVGREIYCEVEASNAGGTGLARTVDSGPIMAAPSPEQPHPPLPAPEALPQATTPSTAADRAPVVGDNLRVQDDGSLVKLECVALTTCTGRLTLTAAGGSKSKARRARVVVIGAAKFSIPGGKRGRVKIKLNTTGRELLSTSHGHLVAQLTILQFKPVAVAPQTKTVSLASDRKTPSRKR